MIIRVPGHEVQRYEQKAGSNVANSQSTSLDFERSPTLRGRRRRGQRDLLASTPPPPLVLVLVVEVILRRPAVGLVGATFSTSSRWREKERALVFAECAGFVTHDNGGRASLSAFHSKQQQHSSTSGSRVSGGSSSRLERTRRAYLLLPAVAMTSDKKSERGR